MAIVPDQVGQVRTLCFINVKQRIIRIHDSIQPRLEFFLQIVVHDHPFSLNGLSNVIRHRVLPLRGFYEAFFISKRKVVEKVGVYSKIGNRAEKEKENKRNEEDGLEEKS